jgi:CRP/FNR family transcriptional regulator, cyclic AMP receptor protein
MKLKTYQTGEVIIQKGDKNRDLFFLVDGAVEASTGDDGGGYILNEMIPPAVFGDFAFFYGLPRTATVKAKTPAEVFILRYENLAYQVKDLPELLKPIFAELIQRIELRDERIRELEKTVLDLEDRLKAKG